MALKISIALTAKSGYQLPVDNIIVTSVHFPKATLNVNEEGVWDGTVTRYITYDLVSYVSTATLQSLDDFVQGGVKEFESGWMKIMTEQEYVDILSNGSLAEVWLKNYIEGLIGADTVTIFDPYVKK